MCLLHVCEFRESHNFTTHDVCMFIYAYADYTCLKLVTDYELKIPDYAITRIKMNGVLRDV